jgi:hypothetical protein
MATDPTSLEVISFEPYTDPVVEHFGIHPTGTYSRIAWLPIVGPTSWVLLGTLAEQLAEEPSVTWKVDDLAEAHGIGYRTKPHTPLHRTLKRLRQFGFIFPSAEDSVLVRTWMPPLSRRQLDRGAKHVRLYHDQTFRQRSSNAV